MKCLDKKRIKMKQGETLALNERIMLSLVSTGVSSFCCLPLVSTEVSLVCFRGCHGRDRMVVGFITTYAIRAYHH
jgi:hypothetical protein